MEISRRMNKSEALIEAKRCLGCYQAPCIQACPAGVNVPGFIKRFREGNEAGASELIYMSNPLAAVCAVACPTANLCEGACTLNNMGQRAIRIGSLQAFVATYDHQISEKSSVNKKAKKIAVVGAGPSGLGCAVQLYRLGHEVEIYERTGRVGGMMDMVIPSYRLSHDVLDIDIQRLFQMDLPIHLKTEIKGDNFESILEQYDAVFLGIGLSKEKPFTVDGLSAAVGGWASALDFLENARDYARGGSQKPELGRKVVIIGGGNVALDAAVVAKKLGADEVTVLYRRTKPEMPGWESEYLDAALMGIEFRWLSVIQSVLCEGGVVKTLSVQKMRRTKPQADGRRGVEIDTTFLPYEMPCDTLLFALGQELDEDIVRNFGIAMKENGTIVTDTDFTTSNPKVFAAGEAVSGGSTIVSSMSQGMAAGRAIHRILCGSED